MSRKQLAALFLCCLVPRTVGNGLVPLLPVYTRQLGASSAAAGAYLALVYIASSLGALSAGWLSDHLGRRKLPMFVASLIGIVAVWRMGRANTTWELTAVTALLWFCGGLVIALSGILAGLSAGSNERGKIFGVLAATVGLGSLIGGLGVGWIVDRSGYAAMFKGLIALEFLWPVCALFVEEKQPGPQPLQNAQNRGASSLGRAFHLLFAASILVSITGYVIPLVRSFVMSDLRFSALAITTTAAIAGLVALPLPVVIGWLSDRIGRKPLLIMAYLAAFVALALLAFSRALWNFWLVFALLSVALQGNTTLGSALVTDLVPRKSLGKALSRFTATQWIGAVIGFAAAGYTLQKLGLASTFVFGGCLALAATGVAIAIRVRPQPGELSDAVST